MILGFERFDVTAQLAETDTISVGGYLTLPERKFAADYPTNIRRLRETGRASLGQTERPSPSTAAPNIVGMSLAIKGPETMTSTASLPLT
jgi:hypothetical protein